MDWNGIADWLSKRGDLSGLYYYGGGGNQTKDYWGQFDPKTKEIALWDTQFQRPEQVDRTFGHEIVHALQYSNQPNKFQTISTDLTELAKMLGGRELIQNMAFPTHWAQGQVEDERAPAFPENPLKQNVWSTRAERMEKAGERASKYVPELQPLETQAYYLTEPGLGVPDQYKQLGMYLRNYGVPWQYIQDLRMYKQPIEPIKLKGD